MGSITIPSYEYGHPKNEDYAYDLARQRKVDMETGRPMSDIGKHLAETLNLANEAARIHIRLGRQQAFEEVRRIIGTASARVPFSQVVSELIALCNHEVKP